jgi:heme-degrading monooxygenase HmoA
MDFKASEVENFDEMFIAIQPQIEDMPGCKRVMLLKSKSSPELRTTLSLWSEEEDLNNYRKSELFGVIWPKTKAKFNNEPIAWSVDWEVSGELTLGV